MHIDRNFQRTWPQYYNHTVSRRENLFMSWFGCVHTKSYAAMTPGRVVQRLWALT